MLRKAAVLVTVRELPNGQAERYEKHLFSVVDLQRWQIACMRMGLPVLGMYETWVWEE